MSFVVEFVARNSVRTFWFSDFSIFLSWCLFAECRGRSRHPRGVSDCAGGILDLHVRPILLILRRIHGP